MSSVYLSWFADGDVDSYNIYRSLSSFETSDLPQPLAVGVLEKNYTDFTVLNDQIYYYRVSSIKGDVEKVSEELLAVSTDDGVENTLVFNLTYDENSQDDSVVLNRLSQAPMITNNGLICNGYDSRLSTLEVPSFLNSETFSTQATLSFYNARLKTTSTYSEPVLFIGENSGISAKPRLALSVKQDAVKSDWSYLGLEYYDTSLKTVPLSRSNWKYELPFPKISEYSFKPLPQGILFLDKDTVVITAHYDNTESKVFKVDLVTKTITGEFTFGTTNRHVSSIASSSDGSTWFCDYDSKTVFKVDLVNSFLTGVAQKSNICNFSSLLDVSSIDFITLSGLEYIAVFEYNTTGTPYMYLVPYSKLVPNYVFYVGDRYKRFSIGRRVQGSTFNNDKLYLSRNRDYQNIDVAGYIERFDNISDYFLNSVDGRSLVPSKSFPAPSRYPQDCKIRPTTDEFWTMTEGFASVSDSDNWLSVWSSKLDDSEVENTYTINRSGDLTTLLINGLVATTFNYQPTITADSISFGGYPTTAKGLLNGFSTAMLKNVAFLDTEIDFSTFQDIQSGQHEPNSLTVVNLPIVNNGAESGVVGWTDEIGSLTTRLVNPVPKFGLSYFSGGSNAQTIARQRLDMLSAVNLPQEDLNNKEVWIIGEWYQASYSDQDPCGVGLRQLDASQQQLSVNYADLVYMPFGNSGVTPNWYKRGYSVYHVDGAKYVDYLYRSDRNSGTSNDGYIDEVSLTVYIK